MTFDHPRSRFLVSHQVFESRFEGVAEDGILIDYSSWDPEINLRNINSNSFNTGDAWPPETTRTALQILANLGGNQHFGFEV